MNYKLFISGLLISACSFSAFAGHERNNGYGPGNDVSTGHFYDYGRVKSVTPIYQTIEHRTPRACQHRYSEERHHRSATPAILGGIIGAAIGNELGHHKSNKRVGAVAGGILGASIGSDISRRPKHRDCQQYDVSYEERVVGYDVSYRYRGQLYNTTTREHPGKKLRLSVQIEPVESRY